MRRNETNIQIDKLKLCFRVPAEELQYLKEKPSVLFVGGYKLKPAMDDRFDYCYKVYESNAGELLFDMDEIGDWCSWGLNQKESEVPVASIKFGNAIDRNRDYVYLMYYVYNHVLYSDKLAEVVNLPLLLSDSISFNNYSELDIALDTQQNVSSLIKKMLRDENITTVVNRKVVSDRKIVIKRICFEYSTSLTKLMYPTVTIEQEKAHKEKGVEIQAYNKIAEIENSSEKYYILKHYDYPKRLYRLEVRLPYQSIKDYHIKNGLEEDMNLIFDKQKLLEMFLHFLDSVIHFKDRSRRKIQWKELLRLSPEGI